MKGLLKNLGILIILIGVGILVGSAITHNLDNNTILGSSISLIIIGFIAYIIINKKIVD
ncbi:hypothetical protein Bcop_0112 [Bacteroides coprosuis DSM 18011]|uniref:Uncharacterized protein n=1 Tax=Bacteroides coprosuis DSM 18011 TaxID=679937 RepID=F3ZPA4_9BACE|nr:MULTISPECIES: hypothetical protein [Bacteroides]EGJ70331.1 hypothetical protein Bcop_0112 [Bacteroides coprosuis DSM 18011]HJD91657.1 hypothetical protein [Bacteroides coprosuis]